jgi:hypothetical protein
MATRKRVESWFVADEFWQRVELLIPVRERSTDKAYMCKAAARRPPNPAPQVFEAVLYRTFCARVANE